MNRGCFYSLAPDPHSLRVAPQHSLPDRLGHACLSTERIPGLLSQSRDARARRKGSLSGDSMTLPSRCTCAKALKACGGTGPSQLGLKSKEQLREFWSEAEEG